MVAIGSPVGYINTVTSGMFSGYIEYSDGTEEIQFDAAISHGSSGGALFNNAGEVIGITSSSRTDANSLNFAIPIGYAVDLWDRYTAGELNNSDEAMALFDAGSYYEAIPYFMDSGNPEMVNTCINQILLNAESEEDFSKQKEAYTILEELKTKGYSEAGPALNKLDNAIYKKALAQYHKGEFSYAKAIFKFLNEKTSSRNSRLYMKLSEVHIYGFHDKDTAEKYYQEFKNDINNSDVCEALVYNDALARVFLQGKWKNENGYRFDVDEYGICRDEMPCVISGSTGSKSYYIFNGNITLHGISSSQNVSTTEIYNSVIDKSISIIDKDHFYMTCYQNNKTYTMTRIK